MQCQASHLINKCTCNSAATMHACSVVMGKAALQSSHYLHLGWLKLIASHAAWRLQVHMSKPPNLTAPHANTPLKCISIIGH